MTEKKTGCQEQGQEDGEPDRRTGKPGRRIEKRQKDRNKERMTGKELILTCRSSVILIPFCHSERSEESDREKVQEDREEFEVGSK